MGALPQSLDGREHGKFGKAGHVMTGGLEKTMQQDYSGTNMIYAGIADIGSATSSAVWQIKKMSYDGSNNLTSVTWAYTTNANGIKEALSNQIWDNRAALTYA